MKTSKILTIAIITVVALVGSYVLNGCQKERNIKQENSIAKENIKKAEITIVISWEKWGRKKKDCNGAGLCNFQVKIEINFNHQLAPKSAEVYIDDHGNSVADILIDEDFIFDEESPFFFIDEKLVSEDDEGTVYVILEGVYSFNPELGKWAGSPFLSNFNA